MAFTTHIEAGFQHQFKTGTVFVDLTAAYDTVCREGLMITFLEAVLMPKAIQFAEQHGVESVLPSFSWRPK
jgi:hypothetical protein